MSLLNLVLAMPLLGFVVALLVPKGREALSRQVALLFSAGTFLLSLGLAAPFLVGQGRDMLFVTDLPWIPTPAIRYHVGVDGVSVWLVLLANLMSPLAILASWESIRHRVKEFFAMLLLLQFALVGVFAALDLFLFYAFYELTLVPMLFLIGIWGGERRTYAAVKFFLYTLAPSLLMLAAMLFLYNQTGTMQVPELQAMVQSGQLALSRSAQLPLFLAFFLAFAVKLALFPVHTWLPDAYAEAPTAGTVMLAAVLSKMGTYGLVRFCLPLFPSAARDCAPWVIVLAIIGILYGALLALIQTDVKRLLGYSSISHLGFVVMGIFAFNQNGLDGAVYQMLNHGVSTGALFLLAGYLTQRRGTADLRALGGGIAHVKPRLATAFVIATLASIGLPSLNNFIGEYLTLQGIAQVSFRYAVFAAAGVVLSACYMLWMVQRVFFGPLPDEFHGTTRDLNGREMASVVPLLLLMAWMGVATQTFLPSIGAATGRIINQTESGVEIQVRAVPAPERNHEF